MKDAGSKVDKPFIIQWFATDAKSPSSFPRCCFYIQDDLYSHSQQRIDCDKNASFWISSFTKAKFSYREMCTALGGVCIIHWALITVYSWVIIYKEDTDISLTPANLPIHIYILPTSRRQVFTCFSVSTYFCLFRNFGCVSPSNVSSCTSVFCSLVHCQAFAVGHIAAQISSFLSLCNLWVIFFPLTRCGKSPAMT